MTIELSQTMLLVFSILGVCGGILCACGDVLFDMKGSGNQKLGTSKNIDSNWIKMADWRFGASIFVACIGDICVALGFMSLAFQIIVKTQVLGIIMLVLSGAACVGTFIHSSLCIQALIYKGVMQRGTLEIADDGLEKMYKQIMPTFFTCYILLMFPSIIVIIAIIKGILDVPIACVLLNPLVFLFVGPIFRKINSEIFQDFPGIVMPSLGLGAISLVGLLALL